MKRGHVETPAPPAAPNALDDVLAINRKAGVSFEVEAEADPAFSPGQVVRTHRHMRSAHTRLPRYARDARGTVIDHHGCHLLPDEGALGRHAGEHLNTVSFAAAELWGADYGAVLVALERLCETRAGTSDVDRTRHRAE